MLLSSALQLLILTGSFTQWNFPDDPFPIEPYMGVEFQPFPKKTKVNSTTGTTTSSVMIRQRKVFFTLGLPVRIKKIELKDSLTKFTLFVTPEIHQTTDYTIVNFMVGPQMIFPFGAYRSNPSALVVEINGGLSTGYLQAKADKVNSDGSLMSADERTQLAGVIGVVLGPQFDIGNFMAFRIRMNTQLYIGDIPLYTIRTEFSESFGMTFGLHGQFSF